MAPKSTAIPTEGKFIQSDYRNADHAMYFDGAFIGARSTHQDAERDLDAYVYDLLEAEAIATADLAAAAIADVLDDLTAAADQVRAEAAPEWTDALDAGWSWLLDQDVISIDAHGSLLVPSSRNPETIYRANGVCQCEAFTKASTPRPCMHRGAGLIIERWRENEAIEQAAEAWV